MTVLWGAEPQTTPQALPAQPTPVWVRQGQNGPDSALVGVEPSPVFPPSHGDLVLQPHWQPFPYLSARLAYGRDGAHRAQAPRHH